MESVKNFVSNPFESIFYISNQICKNIHKDFGIKGGKIQESIYFLLSWCKNCPSNSFVLLLHPSKVIREKSRGEGSLIVQDTIENVSEPKFFFNFLRKKNVFSNFILCQKCFHRLQCFQKKIFAHENMKKPASKVAEPAQIQPKSQFLFHKNLPPRDFSLMTLDG